MAVYTTVSESELCEFLSAYGLAGLVSFQGASEGIENTTYFVTLGDEGKYVLTLFEGLDKESLPFYANLTRVLSEAGLPVPAPLIDRQGHMLQSLCGKPALLFPCITGHHQRDVGVTNCAAIASTLARIHRVMLEQDHGLSLPPNPRGRDWFERIIRELEGRVDEGSRALFRALLAVGDQLEQLKLPRGLVHGDLFRDNTLFHEGRIAAVIDFYNAGEDILLLDLAIVANDWCSNADGQLDPARVSALKAAYASERHLGSAENAAWPLALAWAAGRFWLSRLRSQLDNEPHQKAVKEYRDMLVLRLQQCGQPATPLK